MYQGERGMTAIADWAKGLLDAFNPVGGSNSLLNLISPTITDPIVDLVRNRDFADKPIMPDEKQFGPADAGRAALLGQRPAILEGGHRFPDQAGRLDDPTFKADTKKLKDAEKGIIAAFNKAYLAAVRSPVEAN
jgi:hypothetical protein